MESWISLELNRTSSNFSHHLDCRTLIQASLLARNCVKILLRGDLIGCYPYSGMKSGFLVLVVQLN